MECLPAAERDVLDTGLEPLGGRASELGPTNEPTKNDIFTFYNDHTRRRGFRRTISLSYTRVGGVWTRVSGVHLLDSVVIRPILQKTLYNIVKQSVLAQPVYMHIGRRTHWRGTMYACTCTARTRSQTQGGHY